MGSFIGHVIPGTFFILFGIWWTIQIWRKYLRQSGGFRCQVTYPVGCGRRKIDVEAAADVIAAAIGMLVELFFAGSFRGKSIGVNNMQHATMYFFFGLMGILAMLTPVLKKMFPIIEEIKYIGLAMAFATEALLFKFHLMGRDMLDVTIHTLLFYSVSGCVLMTLTEMVFRTKVLASLGRAYFTILQGTWFWQVAFILYSPFTDHSEWDHGNHHHIMLATCIFTWHAGIIALWCLGCGVGVALWRRKRGGVQAGGDMEPIANGYSHLSVVDEEEEEEHTTKLTS